MQQKKEEYYQQKEIMLSILEPICIHKEFYGYKKERIYDYDENYKKFAKLNSFVWENCFWDYEKQREIWFGDIELEDWPLYHYYLFYDLQGNHTFHTPIQEFEVEDYIKNKNLKIIEIEKLNTFGDDIHDLISNQFVCKIIELIKSNDYILNLNN